MVKLVQIPATLEAGPFTVQEAVAAGMGLGRLRHSDVVCLSRGIRSLDGADNSLQLLTRPFTLITGYSAASHATAFAIWGFPGFLPVADPSLIHISRPKPYSIPRRTGVKGHRTRLLTTDVEFLEGLWITNRVRTWLDCSRRMTVDELVVVADHLLRVPRPEFEGRSEPFATMADLQEALERHKGTPGIQKAREALLYARVGSDSAPETRLRLALGRTHLPEPDVNRAIDLGGGRCRQPDLAFPEFRVVIEYDGESHNDPQQYLRDIRRQEDFEAAGWLVVRIGKEHMKNDAKEAVSKVLDAMWQRGWRP